MSVVRARAGRATGTGSASDPSTVTGYLSVLPTAWTDALGPHLAALVESRRREHSHAIAVVALAAFAIESNVARLMVVMERSAAEKRYDFLSTLPGFTPHLVESVEELFLLRNTLVHNDIWLIKGTSAGGVFTAQGIEKLRGRDGNKARATADRRKTRRHRFNLVPELVGYQDARKATAILVKVTDALAAADVPNMPRIADSARVELPSGHKPLLRGFARMRLGRPRGHGSPDRLASPRRTLNRKASAPRGIRGSPGRVARTASAFDGQARFSAGGAGRAHQRDAQERHGLQGSWRGSPAGSIFGDSRQKLPLGRQGSLRGDPGLRKALRHSRKDTSDLS